MRQCSNSIYLVLYEVGSIFFDPACWWWPQVTPFMVYSAKFCQKWITTQVTLKKSTPDKWHNEIPPSTAPSWYTIWHKHKAQNEAGFPLVKYPQADCSERMAWTGIRED